MYDYIKIVLPKDCEEDLSNCPLLDFQRQYSEKTGEVQYYSIANNNNLQWIIYDSGTILLKGSFHKFYNNGLHNYDDFTFLHFLHTLKKAINDFSIDFSDTKINQFEIGVNIIPPIRTKKILNNLLLHKGKKFQDIHLKGGDYRQCVHSQFILKCYDKSKQYNLPYELLRWEVKFTKMEQLRKLGISNLLDLTKPYIHKKLGEILVQKFEEIIMYDPLVKYNNLKEEEKVKLKDWSNPNYWIELNENTSRTNKNKFGREVKKFRRFIETNSANTQQVIKKSISEKWGQLTNFPKEVIIHELEKIDSSYIQELFPNHIYKTGQIRRAKKELSIDGLDNNSHNRITGITGAKKESLVPDLNINYQDKNRRIGLPKKECLVTGLDISMQKENSKFLCITGIRYYYENEPKIYKELEKSLSSKWNDSPLNVKFCEVSHSIRNEYFNTKYRIDRLLNIENFLFDNKKFINPELLKRYNC